MVEKPKKNMVWRVFAGLFTVILGLLLMLDLVLVVYITNISDTLLNPSFLEAELLMIVAQHIMLGLQEGAAVLGDQLDDVIELFGHVLVEHYLANVVKQASGENQPGVGHVDPLAN